MSPAVTTQSVSDANELDYNRLVYNRLVYNRLVYNRLAHRRLDGKLAFNSLDGLEATEEGRELLLYIARCALPAGAVLIAEHDGHSYAFPGLLGIAPEWEHAGLDDSKARLMSACLLAHVNAYGVSVPISIRSASAIAATDQETREYSVYEGTFFGDVLSGDALRTYSCRGTQPEIARALSSFRAKRVCTDDTDDCQIESVGYCRDVCETRVGEYGWTDCWADGVRYHETVSTYLAYDSASDNNAACSGAECQLRSTWDDAMLSCAGADHCELTCVGDSRCALDAAGTHRTDIVVGGAKAEIDCFEAGRCKATCGWWGTECTIDCKDSDRCDRIACRRGASCVLDCTGSRDCAFRRCDGTLRACPGDVWVCNGSCPK